MISGLAARHVQAHAIQRGHLLAQHRAFGVGVGPGLGALAFVVAARAVGGLQQIEHCAESCHRAAQRSVMARGKGEAAARLPILALGVADGVEAGEKRG
ncbi:hypothetical protein G6F32_016637 [Rhizopus arrhizus]|nr:hypothetical protein G6F32_016637 [Rhizopus arrhizus]